jgi:hypothetical protein
MTKTVPPFRLSINFLEFSILLISMTGFWSPISSGSTLTSVDSFVNIVYVLAIIIVRPKARTT